MACPRMTFINKKPTVNQLQLRSTRGEARVLEKRSGRYPQSRVLTDARFPNSHIVERQDRLVAFADAIASLW